MLNVPECTHTHTHTVKLLVTAKLDNHIESEPKLETMSSSRTNGIQYSILETHNTTWQTTVTVVEHYDNFLHNNRVFFT